jgi:hypothetical protein
MGIEGLTIRNSGTVLDTRLTETECRLSLVRTTVPAELVVFIVTEPKFSEVGETPTSASTGIGNNTETTRNKAAGKHTSSVLPMGGSSWSNFLKRAESRVEGGYQSPLTMLMTKMRVEGAAISDYW